MFGSLRSRLLISYLLIILLTLLIAGAGLLLFLQDFERAILTQRLAAALGPAASQARSLQVQGKTPGEIVAQIQEPLDASWRVFLINNQGRIEADSLNEYVGLAFPRQAEILSVGAGVRRFTMGQEVIRGRALAFAAVLITPARDPQREALVLAAVPHPFLGALQDLVWPLLGAGASALVVAVVIGLLLARSISEPLDRLTRASEAIAHGNYDESLTVQGHDEVARLGESFNTMTRAVRRSQQMQKDLMANVSHELKTPLTSIQGFSQAIADGTIHDLENARHAAKLVYDESLRMARLVGDLLTLARLDSGEVEMEQETLDLKTMLPAWVGRFQQRAEAAGVSLNLAVDSPPPVLGDAGRLEQAVANLIDNAIKYNRPGGRVVVNAGGETQAEAAPRAGLRRTAARSAQFAVIRVSDTGPGIPPSSQPHLFERFFRGDKARVAGGSGLGLAIVKEIVSAHHGKIEVQSLPGVGTTFIVHLPAKS